MKTRNDNSTDGFTMIEAVIAILIMAVLSAPLFQAVSGILHYKNRIKTEYLKAGSQTLFQGRLRNGVMNIRIPYWERFSEDTLQKRESSRLKIPYWKGDRNLYMELYLHENILELSTPGGKSLLKGCSSFKAEPLKTSDGRTTGITFIIESTTGDNTVLSCPFGAIGASVFAGKTGQ